MKTNNYSGFLFPVGCVWRGYDNFNKILKGRQNFSQADEGGGEEHVRQLQRHRENFASSISSIAFQYYQTIKFEGNKYKKPHCVTLKNLNLEKWWEAIESL